MSKGVYIQNVSVLGVYVWVMCLRGYIYIYIMFLGMFPGRYMSGVCVWVLYCGHYQGIITRGNTFFFT